MKEQRFPIRLEYSDWHDVAPKYKSKLIIDRDECEITARNHITGTDLVNTQCFELMEENMQLLFDYVSSEKVNEYEAIPDNEKTSTGSRDGWYTNYVTIQSSKPTALETKNAMHRKQRFLLLRQ